MKKCRRVTAVTCDGWRSVVGYRGKDGFRENESSLPSRAQTKAGVHAPAFFSSGAGLRRHPSWPRRPSRRRRKWSERRDLNPRPLHPQCSALPSCATLRPVAAAMLPSCRRAAPAMAALYLNGISGGNRLAAAETCRNSRTIRCRRGWRAGLRARRAGFSVVPASRRRTCRPQPAQAQVPAHRCLRPPLGGRP